MAVRAAGLVVTGPRAVGVRAPYPSVPQSVRTWVDEVLGSPVESWSEQTGGMSPGCATRVVAEDGTRAFVKAVGADLNPDSPQLFRREISALTLIGADPLWARLLASYDDGRWVALVLEDVDGRHPDLSDDAVMDALLAATDRLDARLASVPAPGSRAAGFFESGFVDVLTSFALWATATDRIEELPRDLVPTEVVSQASRCRELAHALVVPGDEQLLHWDIRNDNLLVRPDGDLVFVDWGAAAVGPAWVDPLLARLERVTSPWFDDSCAASPALVEAGADVVTGWLLAFGCHLARRSTAAADIGLPTMVEFRRTEARRILAGAARRLA